VKEIYITPANSPLAMIFSGLLAAIAWNLITWWYGIPSSSSHTLIGGFAGAFLAAFGWKAINGGIILATAIFIFVAPIAGMLMSYLISVWFLNSFRKGPFMKIVSLTIIALVVFLVYNALEFKRDFNGGSSYTLVFDEKISKDDVKKLLTIKTDDLKEYVPLVNIAKDHSGVEDASGTQYTVRFDYLKRAGETAENGPLTAAIVAQFSKENKKVTIAESHRIAENSADRYDASNLKSSFDSYWLKVVFHGSNFKWILLGFIVLVMGVFTLFLSSMQNSKANASFKKLQLFSSAAFSIGHGGNDAQKVMGIITVALMAGGQIESLKEMPTWVPLSCYAAISLGTMSGGWKIVKTMGAKITKVTPFEGVAAETAGAITLFFTEGLKFPWKMGGEVIKGIPVSTTHTITGSIIGVGITKRVSAVKWGVTGKLLVAWIITIPISAAMGAVTYWVMCLLGF
jgi:phosphate/sulfate permease